MGQYPQGNEVTLYFTFLVNQTPTDPTTVTFRVEQPDGTIDTFVDGVDSEVTNPSVGYYECAYLPVDGGTYNYEIVGTGAVEATSPTFSFTVVPSGIGTTPPLPPSPCEPWIDEQDVAACLSVDVFGTDESVLFDVAQQASTLMFELSGRMYAGQCSRTVRPDCDSCYCGYQVLSRGHLVGWWDWGYPLNLCDSCSVACSPSMIKLAGYPVRGITQVLIDGSVLASSEYRVFNQRYLQRLNDARWPRTNNLTLPTTEDGTWSITYTYGASPPALGVAAAAQVACEMFKASSGAACQLPTGVTRITRQGITIDKLAFTSWSFRDGKWATGLPLVDAFLSGINPAGLQRRPVMWSPGKKQYAQGY